MVHVKICGLTNFEDAQVALEAGADLLGFIFYPKSPRYVAPETVAEIVAALRPSTGRPIRFVGVFVNEMVAQVVQVLAQTGVDLAQLHGNEEPNVVEQLAGHAFKAVRPADEVSARSAAAQYATLCTHDGPRWMMDAYDPKEYGGTGKKAHWHAARDLAKHYPGLLLAGGLTPENVAKAIQVVQPWGVDVASGVEAEPGRKDHAKVMAFVRAAQTQIG